MVNWYSKGQSQYTEGNFHMAYYIDIDGYDEANYDSQDIEGDGESGDPFMAFAIDTMTWTYGQGQVEIGLLGSYRIKIDDSGIWGLDSPFGGGDWVDLLAGGGVGTLDEVFDQGKIIDGANSEANAFQVGEGTDRLKIWHDGTQAYVDFGAGSPIFNCVDGFYHFRYNGASMYYLGNSKIATYNDGGRHIGSSTYAFGTLFYCDLSDETCADFSQYSYSELYNLFSGWKPRPDGILHKGLDDDLSYPHIDLETLPKEFTATFHAGISEDDGEDIKIGEWQDKIVRHGVYKDDGEGNVIPATYEILDGQKCGIDMGNVVYALKELVKKQYEKIETLEERIKNLEEK